MGSESRIRVPQEESVHVAVRVLHLAHLPFFALAHPNFMSGSGTDVVDGLELGGVPWQMPAEECRLFIRQPTRAAKEAQEDQHWCKPWEPGQQIGELEK